jgi:hypothetical protein
VLAAGGRKALASKGAGGARCKLTGAQLAELEAAPAACGHEDQRSTLARVPQTMPGHRVRVTLEIEGFGFKRSGR